MNKKTSAHYQREYRRRLRAQGLVKREVWIRKENTKALNQLALQLRKAQAPPCEAGEVAALAPWTTQSLFEALCGQPEFAAALQLRCVDGAHPAIHLEMNHYGDLPLSVAVCGEQIITESLLWPLSEVTDSAQFNEAILKAQKSMPLSSIGLETFADGRAYYSMFGALSARSPLANILFEIDSLAHSVIQATQAFSKYLRAPYQQGTGAQELGAQELEELE